MKTLLPFLLVMLVSIITGRNVDLSTMKPQQVNQYLFTFGYLKTEHPTDQEQQKALIKFQESTNLVPTGEIDAETLQQMGRPRCGDPDHVEEDRVRRFILKRARWRKTSFRFGIYKYPSNSKTYMTYEIIWNVINDAFEHWENVTNIRFEGVGPEIVDKEDVDIAIGWEKYDHGDDHPFDGPAWLGGKTLAHGFYPDFGGDIHFDDSERWGLTTSKEEGAVWNVTTFELFQVALHEIGHTLGLDHSKELSAVMWPYEHEDWKPKEGLSEDDITGVQNLYGKPTGKTESVAYGTFQSSICKIVKFDAVLDDSHFFVGDQVWKVYSDYNYVLPRNTSDYWEDLPADLDAAVYNNAIYYFFKADLVYAYGKIQKEMLYGFPKLISVAFPGFPNNLDGAFSFENEVFFVKGDYFGKDIKQIKFPPHSPVSAPFDDVEVKSNYIRFIKNGKQFVYQDLAGYDIKLSSIYDLTGPKFKDTQMQAIDLRYDWFQCKKDFIYELP